jgi:tyrosyl-tRNA synthetase
MGREVQRANDMPPQVVMTMPLLEGTDGVRKMSKSFDNYVGLTEAPDEQFGKLMSIPDQLIVRYLRLCTLVDGAEVDKIEAGLADGTLHPNEQKRLMAREVVDLYHGGGAGDMAEKRFDLVHKEREIPDVVPEAPIPAEALRDGKVWLPRLLSTMGLAASNGEARRSIQQGAVRIDGELVEDPEAEYGPDDLRGRVIQVGRRHFLKIS